MLRPASWQPEFLDRLLRSFRYRVEKSFAVIGFSFPMRDLIERKLSFALAAYHLGSF
jgi:hypothetical protein